jgi:hypothetical protein
MRARKQISPQQFRAALSYRAAHAHDRAKFESVIASHQGLDGVALVQRVVIRQDTIRDAAVAINGGATSRELRFWAYAFRIALARLAERLAYR